MPNYRLEENGVHDQFDKSRAKIQIMGGGFGNGKTTALVVLKAMKLAIDYPGSNGLLARATYPKLNDTLRKVFLEWCPQEWVRRRPTLEDNTAYLTNGTVVNFRYVAQRGKQSADGTTSSNLLSATYDWIGVDQIEDPEISHKDMLDLLGRLRGQTPYRPQVEDPTMPSSGPRWLILTANPSPNWFYKEVVQPMLIWKQQGVKTPKLLCDSDTGLPIVDLFEGPTYINAANLTPDFIKTLETTYKGQMRARYLEGKWAAYEGLVYPQFERTIHLLSREQVNNHLVECMRRHAKVYATEMFDFGLTSPSCYMLGFVDDWGRVIIIDGYYEHDFHYLEQIKKIKEIRAKYAGLLKFSDKIWADPSIFKTKVIARQRETGITVAKLFKEGRIDMQPASNDIIQGVTKVSSYLSGREDMPHPVTEQLGAPMIYFCDELEFIEDEITAYYWKKNPLGINLDDPMDHGDHAMDAIKYGLAYLPEAAKVIIPSDKVIPGWLKWQERDIDKFNHVR